MASIATSARTLGTWRKNARGRNLSTIPYYSCYMLYRNVVVLVLSFWAPL
jgi:hypothetical protein